MCVLSLYKGHLTKLRPFVLSFCRTYHIGTSIICRHSFHPSPHLVIVLLDVTTDTHHHFPTCIIRAVLLPPVPHQDSLICAAPVSPITYRSLIIRAVICHPSPRQGLIRAIICCHPSPHLDMDHSCCHFSLISRLQFIIVCNVICHTYIIGLGSSMQSFVTFPASRHVFALSLSSHTTSGHASFVLSLQPPITTHAI